jgi:hypothetical protein
MRLTRRLGEGARILQINMLDHVIIGRPFAADQDTSASKRLAFCEKAPLLRGILFQILKKKFGGRSLFTLSLLEHYGNPHDLFSVRLARRNLVPAKSLEKRLGFRPCTKDRPQALCGQLCLPAARASPRRVVEALSKDLEELTELL